ncbi:MAG TPA: hypothetical protein VK390_09495 [Propionibacteriaceae bacterium]|nr:hypothetical protein [Propionibacteriaceae bacterium]
MEADHPDGRERGIPLWPAVTVPLCPSCHVTKGRMDRAARLEGGTATIATVLRRRAVWCTFLSSGGTALLLPASVLADFGLVLAQIARQIPQDLELCRQR